MIEEAADLQDAADDPSALEDALRTLKGKGFGSKLERIRRERKTRASVEQRIDGRTIKKGHDRTVQVNIKVTPTLKQRLADHCKRKGISIADWMEATLLALGKEN
jgi:hypothetical protein